VEAQAVVNAAMATTITAAKGVPGLDMLFLLSADRRVPFCANLPADERIADAKPLETILLRPHEA
jgi:hypothetical protein